MPLMVFTYSRVHGLYQPGDYAAVDPAIRDGFALVRIVPPNYGALLGALEVGACEPVTAGLPSDAVRALVEARLAQLQPNQADRPRLVRLMP